MKLSIAIESILPYLSALKSGFQINPTTPSFNFFLFRANKDTLSLTAASQQLEITCQLDGVSVEKPEEALVSADKFLKIVSNCGETDVISVTCDGDQTVITGPNSRFKLSSLPADDFPLLDEMLGEDTQIKVRSDNLRGLLTKTGFAMAQNDSRYYLEGTLLALEDKALVAVATDGHRLAVCQMEHTGAGSPDARVILPRQAAQELNKILPTTDDTVSIHLGENQTRIRFGQISMGVKLLEGSKYPDYKRVMPSTFSDVIQFNTDALRQTVARARVVAADAARLSFGANELKVISQTEQDQAEISMPINYGGEAFEVGINPQYLWDVLSVIDAEEVTIEFKDPNSAIQIRESNSEAAKFVVMPLRL